MSILDLPATADAWMALLSGPARTASISSACVATRRRELDAFLQSVERRALYMLELGTRHREEALDLLQDCMLRFVDRYADRPASEWPPLFFRVVSNALVDWQRRRIVRQRVMAIWPFGRSDSALAESAGADAFDAPAIASDEPDQVDDRERLLTSLQQALAALPLRQRQTFLLREWQGLSVSESAQALGVSEGSIKTHLSRAHARLREVLHDYS